MISLCSDCVNSVSSGAWDAVLEEVRNAACIGARLRTKIIATDLPCGAFAEHAPRVAEQWR